MIRRIIENITGEDITKKTKKDSVVLARHLYYYFMRKYTLYSLERISEYTGQSHATALHGIHRIEKDLAYDRELKSLVFRIESLILEELNSKVDKDSIEYFQKYDTAEIKEKEIKIRHLLTRFEILLKEFKILLKEREK